MERMRPRNADIFQFMQSFLDSIDEYTKSVNDDIHYWLVRTMGGDYYTSFINNNYIAIGYNNITLEMMNSLSNNVNLAREQLNNIFTREYEKIRNTGYPVSILMRFCKEVKQNDIVIVPSSSSRQVGIGVVTGNIYEETENLHAANGCPFAKRIPVRWMTTTQRHLLAPQLQLIFNSRHAISDINKYAVYIDSLISDFYTKDDETHLVLRINTPQDINASCFFHLYKILKITERFCQENNIEYSPENVSIKIQAESPGTIRFKSPNRKTLALIGTIVLFINGGGLKIEYNGFNLDLSTNGLFQNINDYLDRKVDRELKASIKQSLDSLQIKTPEDFEKSVIKLYETQNENRHPY